MPYKSEKKQILEALEDLVVAEQIMDLVFDDSDDDEHKASLPMEMDDLDTQMDDTIDNTTGDSDEEDSLDLAVIDGMTESEAMYVMISSMRYLNERNRYPVIDYMNTILMNLPNDKWKEDVRMTRDAFKLVVDLIKNDQVFHNDSNNKQAPVEIQLAVALYRFGTYGNGASTIQVAKKFGVAVGTTELYTNRVIRALVRLYPYVVTWPKQEERITIKQATRDISGFPNCLGAVDGTHIVLSMRPGKNGSDYYTRKYGYAISAMIACDYQRRIRYAHCGYPGSAHDSRVWRNSNLSQNSSKYFNEGEYLLGDKGYPLCENIITPYKAPASNRPENKSFNFYLSSTRVRVEHTIGILKSRFQSLRGLRMLILNKNDHTRAVLWFQACVVLHNLVVDVDGDQWDEEDDNGDDLNGDDCDDIDINGYVDPNRKREYLKGIVNSFNEST